MTPRERGAVWVLAALALLAALVLLGGVLTPFALGAGAAYLLDPLAGRLVRAGLPRGLASLLLVAVLVAVGAAVVTAAEIAENAAATATASSF